MLQFLQFLYRFRSFLLFLVLEIVAFTLIVQNNKYQRAGFISTSNEVIANLLNVSNNIGDFFSLVPANKTLSEENARLRQRISQLEQSIYTLSTEEITDPQIINKYEVMEAEVVNNSVRLINNYLTLNKGEKEGIFPGMSVLGPEGLVGKVKATSSNYSVVYAVLHSNMMVSAKIERTGDLCSVVWDGRDPTLAKLEFVPKHVQLRKGDRIVTSGYSAVHPQDVPIGTIEDWEEFEAEAFLDIRIRLTTDFASLSHVYIVGNRMIQEIDSLETLTTNQ